MLSSRDARVLRLAPHVHACLSDDQVILLDLRRDKYLAVGGTQSRTLAAVVDGWPTSSVVADSLPTRCDLSATTKHLLRHGLLTDEQSDNLRLPAASVPEATESLDAEDAMPATLIGPWRVLRFLESVTVAAASLRCRSLFAIARAVAARRARLAGKSTPFSLEAARDSVAAYEWLRPLLFTSRDACLFDSLALVNFMAREGMFPRWVIGVKTHPFAAHSWVQVECTVLNDLHDHVRKFTPILAV